LHIRHLLLGCGLSFSLLLTGLAQADEGDFSENQLIEPSLSSYAKAPIDAFTAFRFSLIRSSESGDEDLSYTVILKNADEPPSVTIKTFSKTENRVTAETTTLLTKGQVQNLSRGVLMANFWERPHRTKRLGFDGQTWKMEGIDGSQHNITERWSPLPPYYSFVMDSSSNKLVKDPRTPPDREAKSSDEVGLDVFSLMVMYLQPGFEGPIY
jgi:hypothetical protein